MPIDLIGGTSIGSFIAALYARETDIAVVTLKARDWAYVSRAGFGSEG